MANTVQFDQSGNDMRQNRARAGPFADNSRIRKSREDVDAHRRKHRIGRPAGAWLARSLQSNARQLSSTPITPAVAVVLELRYTRRSGRQSGRAQQHQAVILVDVITNENALIGSWLLMMSAFYDRVGRARLPSL